MVVLDEATFLTRLVSLYEANRGAGTVYLQMKRFAGRLAAARRHKPAKQAEAAEGQEPRCLVRARSNKKKVSKISTIIAASDIVRFQLALGNILQLYMDGLKRREKKKEKDPERKKKAPKVKKDAQAKKAARAKAATESSA
mmetsp:Transcript_3601/g.8483  ORF Transcript_3601/g.8483 Transcript_3601/m.8483 type:complete len:141 (+) Transcript_3601:137-559(+)